ncbi:MAG: hypothetical protein U5K72_20430 [Balneolaceae bacterium]|nr:hypothetical protein [Balneolaceae bacterium]
MFLYRTIYLTSVFLLSFMMACSTNTDDDNARYFEFTHQSDDVNYTIVAKTTNEEVIAKAEQELSLPFEERTLHINGPIVRGNPGYNSSWSWHFVENEWDLVELSTEVCDGRPGFVEDELNYWVDNVGRFCPFNSRVLKEVDL